MFTLHEVWQRATERRVKIHWITDSKPQTPDSNFEMIQSVLFNPNFKLRTLPKPVNSRLGIYDHREVLIATTANTDAAESPALWTNCPTVINVLEDYFELKWKLAKEQKIEEHLLEGKRVILK
jgi:hypothetical protein